jgi:hypothetical protein
MSKEKYYLFPSKRKIPIHLGDKVYKPVDVISYRKGSWMYAYPFQVAFLGIDVLDILEFSSIKKLKSYTENIIKRHNEKIARLWAERKETKDE